MKGKLTHSNLIQRKIFTLAVVALFLLITLASCSNASPPVYTVTFNANGGTVDGKESIQSEVAGGTAVKEPSDPIRDGYSFDGWCIEGQIETYDFSNPVNSDLTLEAKWTRLNYKVTFNAKGGTVDGKESIQSEVEEGTAVKEPSDPIRTGYTFDGWRIEGQSENYDFSTPVNSDLTLEAKWTRLYYKVTFNADGGTFSGDDSITVASGDTVSIPASPTKDRYSFDGWYVEGTSEAYDFSTPVNSDLTLVAKWILTHYRVTFNLDGGTFSGEEPSKVEAGKAVSKPSDPTKTGYLFAGWYEEGSDTYYDFSSPVNGDLTIVAAWTDPGAFTYTPVTGGYSVSQGTTALSGLIAIPDTYNEQPVVAISSYAFSENSTITAVTIPASVESIGDNAFYSCTSLRAVTFESGSNLSEIRVSAFESAAIESIEIPASVTAIENRAFVHCTSLSSVTFESGSKLSYIWGYAFYDTAITSIEIPASVTNIDASAFELCTSLSTVTFESGSRLSKIWNYVFANTAITSIEIPESVIEMGFGVFAGCTNLQTIKIGTETIPPLWDSGWNDNCNATVYNSKGEVMGAFTFTQVEGGYSVSQRKSLQAEIL